MFDSLKKDWLENPSLWIKSISRGRLLKLLSSMEPIQHMLTVSLTFVCKSNMSFHSCSMWKNFMAKFATEGFDLIMYCLNVSPQTSNFSTNLVANFTSDRMLLTIIYNYIVYCRWIFVWTNIIVLFREQ